MAVRARQLRHRSPNKSWLGRCLSITDRYTDIGSRGYGGIDPGRMSTSITTPARPEARATFPGLLSLVALLLGVLAGTAVLTAYLLRSTAPGSSPVPSVAMPAPFRVLT